MGTAGVWWLHVYGHCRCMGTVGVGGLQVYRDCRYMGTAGVWWLQVYDDCRSMGTAGAWWLQAYGDCRSMRGCRSVDQCACLLINVCVYECEFFRSKLIFTEAWAFIDEPRFYSGTWLILFDEPSRSEACWSGRRINVRSSYWQSGLIMTRIQTHVFL